jgi:hypothetical protein
MAEKDFEVFIQQQIAAHQTLRWLMEWIFEEADNKEARVLLRQLAIRWQEEDHDSPAEEAFRFYRGMRSSLDEDTWWPSSASGEKSNGVRAGRLKRYRRYRHLFELEIRLARECQLNAMALNRDWSEMERYMSDGMVTIKASWTLWFAGVLFRLRFPGALGLCDGAAFELFRAVYLRA